VTLKAGLGVTRGHRKLYHSIRHPIIVVIGLSRTVSEINGDFRRKSPTFLTPCVFNALAEGVPLGIGYRRRVGNTRMMGLPGDRKSFKIGLAVFIQYRV